MGALAASRARWWEVVGNSEIVKSGIKRVGLDSRFTPYEYLIHIQCVLYNLL